MQLMLENRTVRRGGSVVGRASLGKCKLKLLADHASEQSPMNEWPRMMESLRFQCEFHRFSRAKAYSKSSVIDTLES